MTGRDLIQIIEAEGLEDFNFIFRVTERDRRSKAGTVTHQYTVALDDANRPYQEAYLSGGRIT